MVTCFATMAERSVVRALGVEHDAGSGGTLAVTPIERDPRLPLPLYLSLFSHVGVTAISGIERVAKVLVVRLPHIVEGLSANPEALQMLLHAHVAEQAVRILLALRHGREAQDFLGIVGVGRREATLECGKVIGRKERAIVFRCRISACRQVRRLSVRERLADSRVAPWRIPCGTAG